MIKGIPRSPLAAALALMAVAGCGLAPASQPTTLNLGSKVSAQDASQIAQAIGSSAQAPALADPAAADAALQLDGNPVTVYVQATEKGFEPSVISIPQGMRVRMVLVNRDKTEHHFHVMGLRAGAAMWLVKDDHAHESQSNLTSGEVGDTLEGNAGLPVGYIDHHPCQHFCVNGICYTKNTLHSYAAPNDSDEVIFTPKDKGEFIAGDPLNPDMQATVRVF